MDRTDILGNQSIYDIQFQPQLSLFMQDILIDHNFPLFFEFAPTGYLGKALFDVKNLIF